MNNILYTKEGDLGMRLRFLNGEIVVPDEYGGYVVASGCGSGKTTVIKQIIKENYSTGILYSASTIEECNEMYQFCKELASSDDHDGLELSDIIVLHSSYKDEGVDNNLWRNNPEELLNKKIIICTHVKLMNEDPYLLVQTSFNDPEDELDLYTRSTMSRRSGPMPRRYILIDEVPTSGANVIKVTRSLMLRLSSRVDTEMMSLIPLEKQEALLKNEVYREDNVIYVKPKNYSTSRSIYRSERKNDRSIAFCKDDSKLSEIREALALSTIYKNYDSVWKRLSSDNIGEIRLLTSFLNIVHSRMECSVLIFDGTGDLTFYGSDKFKVLTTNQVKYNSDITLIKINSDLERKQTPESIDGLSETLKSTIDKLENIVRSNNKTLIVTWKNLRNEDSIYEGLLSEKVNEKKLLPEFFSSTLEARGLVPGENFHVIHYQSGLDKATNKFIDCDSIVFLGEFHVPNSVISEFNLTFGCNTTPEFYLLYQLAQAVCRTRIRKHKGLPIKIYYTNDWNDKIMTNLVLYFTGRYPDEESESKIRLIKDYVPEDITFIKPKFRSDIMSLMKSDLLPGLTEALLEGESMSYRVKLTDIYRVIPKGNYQIRSYNSLVKYLSSLKIELKIESDSRYTGK